jgi:hypothetical protein
MFYIQTTLQNILPVRSNRINIWGFSECHVTIGACCFKFVFQTLKQNLELAQVKRISKYFFFTT